jgi:[acyl-carrier-protein] S-malonyltransferase
VVNNIDVAVETDPTASATRCTARPFGPVRWVEVVQAIKAMGLHTVVECGPGKVLAGMVKRIDAALTGLAMYDPATLAEVKGSSAVLACPQAAERK